MSQLIAGYIDIILKKRKEQERAEARAAAKEVPFATIYMFILPGERFGPGWKSPDGPHAGRQHGNR